MKKASLLALVLFATGHLMAQDFVAPLQQSPRHPEPQAPSRQYEGVAARWARARNPLQMLNPFAPKSLGTGEELVAYEVRAQQAENPPSKKPRPIGIRILSISF